ncbi:hypothetical protein V6N13_109129 [Hibiscus sabdariffa]
MASIAISASLQRSCSSHHVTRKQHAQSKPSYSLGARQVMNAVTLDVEGQKGFKIDEKEKPSSQIYKPKDSEDKLTTDEFEIKASARKFEDERWKNGTWDLNMFVRNGRMDWDGVIVAEAKRRKYLEMYPEACSNQEPVQFRSSIIPWWAWFMRTYLPEAELINGRAAMIGFFMAYVVDGLTGMDLIGQTGNFICKTGLFATVVGVVLLRKSQDFDNLRKLADEFTSCYQEATCTIQTILFSRDKASYECCEGQKGFKIDEKEKPSSQIYKLKDSEDKSTTDKFETGASARKFEDERWKNGTWDLNMFVRNGRMNWDGVIVAEAKRRKYLEMYPEACSNQEPIQFRSSIIPWWAWFMRTYLPEVELVNG